MTHPKPTNPTKVRPTPFRFGFGGSPPFFPNGTNYSVGYLGVTQTSAPSVPVRQISNPGCVSSFPKI